jgi:AraC-like DNA-binding protein
MASWNPGPVSNYVVCDSQVNAEGVHVWPFEPHFPIDALKHNLSGRQPFRMNRHDYVEVVYLNSGELVWQVGDRCVREERGDLFVMLRPRYHRLTEFSSAQVTAESLFFHPQLLRVPCGASQESEYLTPFFDLAEDTPYVVNANTDIPGEVVQLMRRIRKQLPATSDHARLAVKTYLKLILVHLMNHFTASQKRFPVTDQRRKELDRFKPVFEYLQKNFGEAVSPQEAAETVNMSPSHFRRAFKHLTGQSFVPYLNHFRVERAQQLLANTGTPISEIGLDVGFCDQSYFGLIFRRLTNMTPRQYRQQALTRNLKAKKAL